MCRERAAVHLGACNDSDSCHRALKSELALIGAAEPQHAKTHVGVV